MNKVFRNAVAFIALVVGSTATAQSLVPVADSGGANWSAVLLIAALVAVVAGLIFWHRRAPASQEKALAEANVALKDTLAKMHEALTWSQKHVAELIAKVPETAAPVPEVPPGPTAEQLAAIEQASQALAAAKAAAGIKEN